MRFYDECSACAERMTRTIGELLGASETSIEKVIKQTRIYIRDFSHVSPPQMVPHVYQWFAAELPGHPLPIDPYKDLKRLSNQRVAVLAHHLAEYVENSADPLAEALRVAAAGNIIDFGAHSYDAVNIEQEIQDIPSLAFRMYDFEPLKTAMSSASRLLYIGDNAGEVYFDKVLLEQIRKAFPGLEPFYAVRSRPVLNDATREDAYEAGIPEIARVIESGSHCPGVVLSECTDEFRELFRTAGVIIAKGQGNLETLLEQTSNGPLFHILRVKCECVAMELGQPLGSLVLWRNSPVHTSSSGSLDLDRARALLRKYGITEQRIEHSQGVADFARDLATRIVSRHPHLTIDPVKVYFGGLLHDIGRGMPGDHERNSEEILQAEGFPEIAGIVMHGTLYEATVMRGKKDPTTLPSSLENKLVAYADARYRLGPVSLAERFDDVRRRRSDDREKMKAVEMAQQRFTRYEKELMELAS